jgi:hypothetical protein
LLRELEAPPKCHKHHLIEKDLYQMVLRRPVEPARLLGNWLFDRKGGFPVTDNPVYQDLDYGPNSQ